MDDGEALSEDDVQRLRAARRRAQLRDRETAPSYWSAFTGWQWLGAAALLAVIALVFALAS
ncbi:MAG TPA: hypothetical protein VHG72_01765 [Polyangia bacterium]|nr:hypothetical protein [Polyangia bacterium]